MDEAFLQQVRSAIEENKPYLALSVDLVDGKVEFGASVYVNGNENESWSEITPEDFIELLKMDYSRIYFHHMDMSSDEMSEQQLDAVMRALGVPLPTT